eukprot:TRINITY_DN2437_c0_g1_i7.p1 TRINITY_DN2437_c0_g1~~TRINITY_DN2437_c0_g1_i7.p1  ORF type:complete len:421 (-),score=76.46 TRINITY_DN2437_c0_g1_i7:71-1333(-)
MDALCAEWEDDQRMNALFAPVRSKQVNPESWQSKINFWLNLIEKWCDANEVAMVDLSLLKKIFTRNGKSPHCLEDVLQEGVKSGDLAPSDAFLQSLSSAHQTWGAWMVGLGTGAIKKVGSNLLGYSASNFTVIKTTNKLRAKVEKELSLHENYISCRHSVILTEEQINAALGIVNHDGSRNYILQVLLADKKLIQFTTDNRTFYKLTTDKNTKKEFDEIDRGLIRLKTSIEHLELRSKQIEERHNKETSEVKRLMKEGKRTSAKACLRKAKRFEAQNSKVLEQVLGLETLFDELMSAESNNMLLDTYQTGLQTLKTMVNPDMLEKADNTMSELVELIDLNNEIADGLTIKDDSRDEELDKELEMLAKESDENIKTPSTKIEGGDPLIQNALNQLDDLNLDDLDPLIATQATDAKNKVHAS